MDQCTRFTCSGYEVKPAPRDHERFGHAENAIGDRIAMMVIVEQPGIDVAFAERRLNSGEVHGQNFIVNNTLEFREWVGEGGNQCARETRHQRRTATRAQTASTRPKGHAPCRNP